MKRNIIKLIPESILVKLYKKLPLPLSVKKKVIWYGNRRFLVSVQGIILNNKNEVLLLKHTYRKNPWGIPGGWMDYEHPSQGLVREIYEETSFKISVIDVIKTEYVSSQKAINIIFSGKYISGEFTPNSEISEYGFFTGDNLPNGLPDRQRNVIINFFSVTK